MQQNFQIQIQSRKIILKIVEGLSSDQLNKIPEGFSNNIIWNMGHLLVTQQLICYRLASLDTAVSESLIQKYQKGTAPQGTVDDQEIALIKSMFVPLAKQLKEDYDKGLFQKYTPYNTSVKISLNSIEEGLDFNTYHEGIHLGILLQLLKFV